MKIGILASGGDGAGMNACLYKIASLLKNDELILFNRGYFGLINNELCNFDYKYIKQHSTDGGIMIKTSRCPEFKTQPGIQKAVQTYKLHNLDGLIVMGGNGSLMGAKELEKNGLNIYFIPCTIDNDVAGSEYCIGFDTACHNCTEFINNVNATMKSFNRTCIYEAMGRECPAIAITVANRVDADYLYVGKSCSIEECVEKIKIALTKKDAPIILLRENLVDIQILRRALMENLNIDVKTCIVGYIQRGGKPTKLEIKNAYNFAKNVVKNIKNKQKNVAIIVKNGFYVTSELKNI